MKTVKLATFIENPDNPQTVTAEDFALLVESLRTMPQTLAASKIAYATDYARNFICDFILGKPSGKIAQQADLFEEAK